MDLRSRRRSGERIATALSAALGVPFPSAEAALDYEHDRVVAFASKDASTFREFYLRSEILSKFTDDSPESADARRRLAFEKFLESEEVCRRANENLVDPWTRVSLDQHVWRKARLLCSRILSRFPMEDFPWACGFGPGASGSLPSRESSHQNKWESSSQITVEALPFYLAFHRWASLDTLPSNLEVVRGNRVTTVPKNWKTDRVIAIEPDWNMFFQKGVGKLIRRRLQRIGLLLDDAQDTQRALARVGSETDDLATLDLSAASDSISLALCEALLPPDWFRMINLLRSPQGILDDGTEITYAKVSSMGNGYTFELETLLFYCLCAASCRKGTSWVSVYGDDIVVPSSDVERVVQTLSAAGFAVNQAKSFVVGPFRESCGGHYFKGEDVTPFYLRHMPETLGDFITLGNAIVTWSSHDGRWGLGEFIKTYRRILNAVPRSLRGPYGLDGCLWSEWDRCCPQFCIDTQSFEQKVIQRQAKYLDVSCKTGSYTYKLWVESPEVETSRLPRVTTREICVRVYVDRTAWSLLPVRLA